VPGAGIEPARLAAGDFESPASTNFTTRAGTSEDRNYGTVWGMKFPSLEVSIANKPPAESNGRLLHAQPNHFFGLRSKNIYLQCLQKRHCQPLLFKKVSS
jgi:hypothetical protein